jgi:hypothetical protein
MKVATHDRGEIIHWAGRNHRSPALLADGKPTWVTGADPAARRCGWEAFFDALRASDRVLVYDPADEAAGTLEDAGAAVAREAHAPPHDPMRHAKRVLEAIGALLARIEKTRRARASSAPPAASGH